MSRMLITVSRIIFYYSIFYSIIKCIAIIKGEWLIPNLLLMLPFIIFAIVGWQIEKRKSYNWYYVGIGVLIISLIRYYETDWIVWIQHQREAAFFIPIAVIQSSSRTYTWMKRNILLN